MSRPTDLPPLGARRPIEQGRRRLRRPALWVMICACWAAGLAAPRQSFGSLEQQQRDPEAASGRSAAHFGHVTQAEIDHAVTRLQQLRQSLLQAIDHGAYYGELGNEAADIAASLEAFVGTGHSPPRVPAILPLAPLVEDALTGLVLPRRTLLDSQRLVLRPTPMANGIGRTLSWGISSAAGHNSGINALFSFAGLVGELAQARAALDAHWKVNTINPPNSDFDLGLSDVRGTDLALVEVKSVVRPTQRSLIRVVDSALDQVWRQTDRAGWVRTARSEEPLIVIALGVPPRGVRGVDWASIGIEERARRKGIRNPVALTLLRQRLPRGGQRPRQALIGPTFFKRYMRDAPTFSPDLARGALHR